MSEKFVGHVKRQRESSLITVWCTCGWKAVPFRGTKQQATEAWCGHVPDDAQRIEARPSQRPMSDAVALLMRAGVGRDRAERLVKRQQAERYPMGRDKENGRRISHAEHRAEVKRKIRREEKLP